MKRPPNIILVCFDQMGAHCLPAFGNEIVRTPNLDRLAQRGVVFDHCITASPVCGPARASMMTGLYPSRHGVWTNEVPPHPHLRTFAHELADLGYFTASVGKMHFTPALEPWGFLYQRRSEDVGRAQSCPERDGYLSWLARQGVEYRAFKDQRPGESGLPLELHQDSWVAEQAVRFLRNHGESPFFLFASFIGPHDPVNPPAPFHEMYDWREMPVPLRPAAEREGKVSVHLRHRHGWTNLRQGRRRDPTDEQAQRYRACYFGYISYLDSQVGRVLAALEELGLAENTHIVFTTDHGEALEDHWLRAKGPWCYEATMHIPLVVAGPGVAAGDRCEALANHIDLGATFLDWAGGDPAFGQGLSLAGVCAKPARDLGREVAVAEFNDTAKILRDRRWSFAYYPGTRECELYDRDNDPDQLENLAGRPEYSDVERRFLQEVIEFEIQQKPFQVEAKDFSPELIRGMKKHRPHLRLRRADLRHPSPGDDVDELLSWFD